MKKESINVVINVKEDSNNIILYVDSTVEVVTLEIIRIVKKIIVIKETTQDGGSSIHVIQADNWANNVAEVVEL